MRTLLFAVIIGSGKQISRGAHTPVQTRKAWYQCTAKSGCTQHAATTSLVPPVQMTTISTHWGLLKVRSQPPSCVERIQPIYLRVGMLRPEPRFR